MILEIFPEPIRSGGSEHEQCATSLFTCAGRPGRQTQYFLTLRPASAACARDINVYTPEYLSCTNPWMSVMVHVTGEKIRSIYLPIHTSHLHTRGIQQIHKVPYRSQLNWTRVVILFSYGGEIRLLFKHFFQSCI